VNASTRILLELWDPSRKAGSLDIQMLERLCEQYPAFSLPFALLAIHSQSGQPSVHEAAVKAAAVRIPERERLFDRLHRDFARPFEPNGEEDVHQHSPQTAKLTKAPDPMDDARRRVRQILEENRRMRERAALESGSRSEEPAIETQAEKAVVVPRSLSDPLSDKPQGPPEKALHAPIEQTRSVETPSEEPPAEENRTEDRRAGQSEAGVAELDSSPVELDKEIESTLVAEPQGESRADVRKSLEEWLRSLESDDQTAVFTKPASMGAFAAKTAGPVDGLKSKSLKIKKKKLKKIAKKALKRNPPEARAIEIEVPESKNRKSKKDKFDLIDKFIEKLPELRPEKNLRLEADARKTDLSKTEVGGERGSMWMTETLAELYAEQKHYRLALEAYEILLLKFPEKSSFFAARISELRKRAETQA